jgi:hypothetical protein
VVVFEGDSATIVLHPAVTTDAAQPLALTWNVATNQTAAAPADLVSATDYFPATNEAVLVNTGDISADSSVPPSGNTIRLFNLGTSEVQQVYQAATNLIGAKFVQNGKRLLVFADSGERGILIERDGTVVKEFENLPGESMTFGIPEGFLYRDPNSPGSLVIVKTDDNSFTANTFYTSPVPFTALVVENGG